MTERVLFVFATPGDETTLTGATIARLIADGSHVTVLTCVSGTPLEDEFATALATLGVTEHRVLGAAGARWEGLPAREYWSSEGTPGAQALAAADLGEVASDVGAVILDLEPTVVVSYSAAKGIAGDRRVVHEATRWATEVLSVPFFVVSGAGGSVRVDDAQSLATKNSALAAYQQHVPSVDRGAAETLARLRPGSSGIGRATPLSRVLSCALALILGAFVGIVLTAVHQSSVAVGETQIPWGLIVALTLTATLLAGLRLVYETRLVAGFATAGLLGAEALLSVATPGGSIVVPNNVPGIIWTVGSVLIAAVVLAWPQVARPAEDKIRVPAAKGPDLP